MHGMVSFKYIFSRCITSGLRWCPCFVKSLHTWTCHFLSVGRLVLMWVSRTCAHFPENIRLHGIYYFHTKRQVFPQGWDKTYCLRYLEEFQEIHFFGDKTYKVVYLLYLLVLVSCMAYIWCLDMFVSKPPMQESYFLASSHEHNRSMANFC